MGRSQQLDESQCGIGKWRIEPQNWGRSDNWERALKQTVYTTAFPQAL